ncbi:winged helix-turn-helix domain-containing protein [Aquabacterium sp.]|uniref:winged helix-turn-helix domain-containing protein n=1 Tax=Aquabacterium sp. TaxID=1872578 RepID=UPI002E36EF4E|nr:winged helix-turn-helix domain-containing protein [Aquabacterium sp.]HEX5310372.1 winged helix-turn-helix domain-containing protein [Aquabacterium sp.]
MAIAVHTSVLWHDARSSEQADLLPALGVALVRFGFGVSDDLEPDLADMLVIAADRALEVCQVEHFRQARQAGVPVVVLLSAPDVASRVAMLDLGADECLSLPCDWRELAARLHALRRRRLAEPAPLHRIRFAQWELDTRQCTIRAANDSWVKLAQAEYQLLLTFLSHPYQVIAPNHLMHETRQRGLDVADSSMALLVTRLRCKLGDDPREPSLIHSVRGQGYLFNAAPHVPLSVATHNRALAADLLD